MAWSVAYVREGAGGYPLVLVHGWPETKRIWWRNVAPLAEAGFEVIVPDLRGSATPAWRPRATTTWPPARVTCTRWCTTCSGTSDVRRRAATTGAW